MSTLRHRFRIVIDNGPPVDIVTSARDMAQIDTAGVVDEDGTEVIGPGGRAMWTWQLLHAACLRLDVPGIPHDLDKFVDLLDEIDDLDGIPVGRPGGGLATVDPTQTATSGDSP